MASVEANGITIEYEEQGSGEPLLLVMGLAGQLSDWSPEFLDALAAHFRVIRFDNRDIGLSTEFSGTPPTDRQLAKALLLRRPIESEYRLSDMADDAAGLLDALGIDAAHVVGMSMGGMIGQTMAINHPHRVRSLTSVMSNTGDRKNGGIHRKVLRKLARRKPPTRETAAQDSVDAFRLFAGSSWDPQRHLERAQISVDRSWRPAGVARQNAAILASPDRTPDLAKVTTPTLVIHGLQDKLVKPSGGIATARAIPGSRLLMFPDMGHDLPETRRAETVEAIVTNTRRAAAPQPA